MGTAECSEIEVQSSRFGSIAIATDRVITFPKGILGFASAKRFCLLEPAEDACFFWLQSLDQPDLAFVVTDPMLFVPEYSVPISPMQMCELGLRKLDDAQVLVIVNKRDGQLTGNLAGPLVINTLNRHSEQIVLADRRWTTRHPFHLQAGGPRA